MPILSSAKKALRRDRRRAAFNLSLRSKIGSLRLKALENPTAENIAASFSAIDRGAKRHVIHKNKAARLKSRLSLASGRKG